MCGDGVLNVQPYNRIEIEKEHNGGIGETKMNFKQHKIIGANRGVNEIAMKCSLHRA